MSLNRFLLVVLDDADCASHERNQGHNTSKQRRPADLLVIRHSIHSELHSGRYLPFLNLRDTTRKHFRYQITFQMQSTSEYPLNRCL